jgi:uncharacterized protein (TIGR00251 family)
MLRAGKKPIAEMARLNVKVSPKSSRSGVVGRGSGGELRVNVHAAPIKGAANDELLRVLADFFGCAPSACRILRGAAGKRKVMELEGVSETLIKEKIQCLT